MAVPWRATGRRRRRWRPQSRVAGEFCKYSSILPSPPPPPIRSFLINYLCAYRASIGRTPPPPQGRHGRFHLSLSLLLHSTAAPHPVNVNWPLSSPRGPRCGGGGGMLTLHTDSQYTNMRASKGREVGRGRERDLTEWVNVAPSRDTESKRSVKSSDLPLLRGAACATAAPSPPPSGSQSHRAECVSVSSSFTLAVKQTVGSARLA